jgi:hypothetical protein
VPEHPQHNRTETSKAAARKQFTKSARDRQAILECLKTYGPKTDWEIQFLTGLNENSERARRVQLVEKLLVRSTKRTELYGPHLASTIWELVPAKE